jgi:hypothetical protein
MRNLGMLLGEAGAAVLLASAVRSLSPAASHEGILRAVSEIGVGAASITALALALSLRLAKRNRGIPRKQ